MLYNKIDGYIADATKGRDMKRVDTLRLVKAAFLNFEKAKGAGELNESVEIKILKKMVQERKESSEMYAAAGPAYKDRAERELYEISVISEFLPEEVSAETIEAKVLYFIYENKLESIPKQMMGQCVKYVKAAYPMADGKTISEIVKNYIEK